MCGGLLSKIGSANTLLVWAAIVTSTAVPSIFLLKLRRSTISTIVLEIPKTPNFLVLPNHQHGLQHGILHSANISGLVWMRDSPSKYRPKLVDPSDTEHAERCFHLLL
jgi:hypothetical protein